ncbi:unnamed protein product, partial [Coregonus sp. 'balchen']
MLLLLINRNIKKGFTIEQLCVKRSCWLQFWGIMLLFGASFGDVRYSVPEEMERGSVIGNLALDLGLKLVEIVFPTAYGPPSYTDVSRCGTLLKDDRYDAFLTTGSWKGDFRFRSSIDTDTLRKSSVAYQKGTLRRTSLK